ncbi:hypothetical protein HF086_010515, partial [Spodoptera exigua]
MTCVCVCVSDRVGPGDEALAQPGRRHGGQRAPAPPAAGPAAPPARLWSCADIKKSYVDVLNPGGAGPAAAPAPAPGLLGPSVPLQPPPNYFVPAPLPQPNTDLRGLEVERPEAIEVMIPPSPTPSYSETPPPSPIPDVDPEE